MLVEITLCFMAFVAANAAVLGPCHFDGQTYPAGSEIVIQHCLGTMTCLGNENYGNLKTLGGVCPETRDVDGQKLSHIANGDLLDCYFITQQQAGCLFDGRIYAPGDKITIGHCLAEMTCLGRNAYTSLTQLGGICPEKRETDGQKGCLFDGRVYGVNEIIQIPTCLGEMTCLGQNNYSPITPLFGVCPNKRAVVNGQTGCLYDGRIYAPNEEIIIPHCLAKFTCLGNNNYSDLKMLGGVC